MESALLLPTDVRNNGGGVGGGGGGRWAADGGEIDAAERSQETIRQSARSEEGTTATREELMSAFS